VYFEGSPPAEEEPTLGCYAPGSPPILYVPTFPWKCFFSTKWEGSQEIKRELVCVKGRFLYSCVLLRFPLHRPIFIT